MRIVLALFLVAGSALLFACGGTAKKTPAATPSVAAATAPASSPTRDAATNTAVPATIAAATPTPAAATIAAPTAAAAPSTAAPQATEVASDPTIAAPPPPPPPASGGALTLVALNLEFDTSSLSAAAGPVAVTLDNQDRGIAHNIHFFSKTGSIGMTDVDSGPSMHTLTLGPLAPGAYSFKCDVHPTTMKGILTVS